MLFLLSCGSDGEVTAKTLEKFYTTYNSGKLFHLFGTIWNIRTVWGSIRKNPILISRDKKSREIARDLYKVTTKLQKFLLKSSNTSPLF